MSNYILSKPTHYIMHGVDARCAYKGLAGVSGLGSISHSRARRDASEGAGLRPSIQYGVGFGVRVTNVARF